MVASESGSPLQHPQAHPGAAVPRLLLHPRMRYLGKTISWRLCGITSIYAFLFSNVDDVLTYVEGWQRATIGRLSNLHRRTLRKLAMYSRVCFLEDWYNEKSKFGPVFSVQIFSRSTYMITGYDDCYNLTEMKWHVENMTSPGGATTRRHGPKAISLVLGFGGNCIHHPAKKIQQSRDLDTFIADVISSASSKVVAAFAERREEKISFWNGRSCMDSGVNKEFKLRNLCISLNQLSFKNYNGTTCKAYTVPDFERSISGIKEMRTDSIQKLRLGFEKMVRAYALCKQITTTDIQTAQNLIIALTRTVRKVPIMMLMNYYRDLLQRWYSEVDTLVKMNRWQMNYHDGLLQRFRVYQVKDNKTVHVVDLVKRECSCINWQLSGLPRGHVCAMSRCDTMGHHRDACHSFLPSQVSASQNKKQKSPVESSYQNQPMD
ncbi:hypothetical protein Tco_0565637 [Tanacetum coccineum]